MEIKEKDCILFAEKGDARIVWFDDLDSILYFEDLPSDDSRKKYGSVVSQYRWRYGSITSQRIALEGLQALTDNGWKVRIEKLSSMIPKLKP